MSVYRARGPKSKEQTQRQLAEKSAPISKGSPTRKPVASKNGNDLPFHTLDIHLIAENHPSPLATVRSTLNGQALDEPPSTLKMRMGATHFLMKTLPKVATEMALHVLAYNLTRVMNIVGIKPLLVAIRA